MAIWFHIGLLVASALISYALRPRIEQDNPPPASLAEFDKPTVEEGVAIPSIWGRVKLTGPLLAWYGDYMAGGDPTRYQLSMWYCWCSGPLDEVFSFQWDDLVCETVKKNEVGLPLVTFPIERTDPDFSDWASLFVDQMDLFGGTSKEGGVQGLYAFYWGTSTQPQHEGMGRSILGGADLGQIPAYRRLCYSWLGGWFFNYPFGPWLPVPFHVGQSPYLKTHALDAGRYPATLGLTAGHERIGDDSNPAEILYEVCTHESFGCNIPSGMIDVATLQEIGETLYQEEFGLSLQTKGHTDGETVVQEVLRHIDGVKFTDPQTGQLTFQLIRGDYDPATLPHLDEGEVLEVRRFLRPGLNQTFNKVQVKYTDIEQEHKEKVATAIEQANVRLRGGVYPQDLSFLGITHASLAQRVAARELKSLSFPFARGTLVVNRVAWDYHVGSVFRWSSAEYGISEMVLRVLGMRVGPVTDGRIELDVVQDAFSVDWTAYSPPSPSGWTFPLTPPT